MAWKAARTLTVLVLLFCSACTTLKRCSYEGVNRDDWQQPNRVIRSLKIQSGAHIADLGSGGGYFTFRLARAVGPQGRVYATDVDNALNDYVRARAREQGLGNIEVVLAKYDDPSLPVRNVDLIFSSNTYHHIENRVGYFANAKKYLADDARIAIIEFNGRGWFQTLFGHHTPSEVIKQEMQAAGYRLTHEFDFLPKQSFLVFSSNERGDVSRK